jgi:hypothetical protein
MAEGFSRDFLPAIRGVEILFSASFFLKDRLGDQRGGSEWEPIKILLEGD